MSAPACPHSRLPARSLCRAEAAVVAALLHDVLDDTDADLAEIQELFGEQVGVRAVPAGPAAPAGLALQAVLCC